jgi:hypothetical protein
MNCLTVPVSGIVVACTSLDIALCFHRPGPRQARGARRNLLNSGGRNLASQRAAPWQELMAKLKLLIRPLTCTCLRATPSHTTNHVLKMEKQILHNGPHNVLP